MKIEEARTLKAALERGIAKAEAAASTTVDLAGELDAELGAALDEAQAALDKAKAAGA